MKSCNPSCVTAIPNNDWSKDCDLTERKGGIPYLTFLKCDPDYVHPNPSDSPWEDLDNIKVAICAGILYISAEVLGQKPKGTFTKRRLSSCAPEKTISGTKTITFQDFNADKENLIDFDFWNGIDESKRFMSFGWITCDERWYQTNSDWDLEIDEVIEDTKDGMSYYDGIVTISEKSLIKPILVPGLIDLISSFLISEECYS